MGKAMDDAGTDALTGLPRLPYESAEAALASGDLETCLQACRRALEEHAGDEARWTDLRDRALVELRQRAAPAAGSAAARWLGLLVRHDPRAANSVHLAWSGRAQASNGTTRAEREIDVDEIADAGPRRPAIDLCSAERRLTATLDEAGEYAIAVGEALTLGIEGEHPAVLVGAPALRGGRLWRLEPGSSGATVDGRSIGPLEGDGNGVALHDGQQVELSTGGRSGPLRFRLHQVPNCDSVLLSLVGEGEGPAGVVLMTEGRDGRVRIGDRSRCLIRSAACPGTLELWSDGDCLRLRSSERAWLRSAGDAAERELEPDRAVEFRWPWERRIDMRVPFADPRRAPFWMRLDRSADDV